MSRNLKYSTVSLVAPDSHSLLLSGRYFLTVITTPRRHLLSVIEPDGTLKHLPQGMLLKAEFDRCAKKFPMIHFDASRIMPDHFHLCFRVLAPLSHKITEIITQWLIFSAANAAKAHLEVPPWNYRYRLFAAVTEEKYQRCIDYTNFNDDCASMAQDPGLFCGVHTVRHPRLDPAFDWDCFGDDRLLGRPDIIALHVHRDETADGIRRITETMMLAAKADMTIAGGFISESERNIIRSVRAAYPMVRIIHFRPESLRYYKPTSKQRLYFLQHRWLEITSVPRSSEEGISRAVCIRHNTAAETLAGGDAAVCFGEVPHRMGSVC